MSDPHLDNGEEVASGSTMDNGATIASDVSVNDDITIASDEDVSNGGSVVHPYRPLNSLLHLQAMLERMRIGANNQLRSIPVESGVYEVYRATAAQCEAMEHQAELALAQEVKKHPAWPWLEGVRGIGPQAAGLMLGYLLPPRSDKGPSSWYKAAGLYAIQVTDKDGSVESRLPRYSHLAPGQKATWHPGLRRNLYVVATCLLRANGSYKAQYDDMKAVFLLKHPDWKGRCHAVAQWKMVKLFLAHLWEMWSEAEGIPCREPYPVAELGHAKIEVPRDGG